MIRQEWKNGTVAWWFTLPVSRSTLVCSKFTAIVIESLAKPVVPLFWIVWVGMWWICSTLYHVHIGNLTETFAFSTAIFSMIGLSWMLSYLMLRLSAYLLKRHLTLYMKKGYDRFTVKSLGSNQVLTVCCQTKRR